MLNCIVTLFLGEDMAKQLKLFHIDMKYIRDLHKADDKVLSVSPQIGKSNRVFLGVFNVGNNRNYAIPLSHAEDKYNKLSSKADFEKIYDAKGRLVAVLRLNLMIPVEEAQLIPVDLTIHQTDSPQVKAYKNLCKNEIRYCKKIESAKRISDKVLSLYDLCANPKSKYKGKDRCVDFKKTEAVCDKYNKKHGNK